MHIKRYTIASLLLIALVGWYIGTFVSSESISINIFGVVLPSLSVAIWISILLFMFYLASLAHISFYSIMGSFRLRKYEKDYEKVIDSIVDAYLGKENRHHVFKTPRYKLLGSLIDNTTLFPNNIDSSSIEDEKIKSTLKLIEDIKNGEVVELKKLSLPVDNPLVVQNNRNRYRNGDLNAEDILSHPDNYDDALLKDVYIDFVKTSPVYAIENYKQFMSKEALFEVLARVNAEENTIEISNDSLIALFETLELDTNDYVEASSVLSYSMIPEYRIKLFETISDEKEEAMDAYLFTLFDLEMLAPADAILEISQPDEFLNFKAYRALKDTNHTFNIKLFCNND
jgi:hypothetical protein